MVRSKLSFSTCSRCGLCRFRTHVVVGRGRMPAPLLFLGEAPGRAEDLRGVAFCGQSGKLLDKMIEDAGLDLGYYITNCVLCRPTDTPRGENRAPRTEEILACSPNVHRILSRARPQVVVLLGQFAQRYFRKEFPTAVPLPHPAYILRQGGRASPGYGMAVRGLREGVLTRIKRLNKARIGGSHGPR